MSPQFQIHHGDLFDVLKTLPADSIDSCVTDPPYGIRFMGKAWDGADIVERTKNRAGYSTDESARAGANGGHRSIAAEAGKYDRSNQANQAFQQFSEAWGREVFRVLKPGAHVVSFASCRTYHRMVSGLEDAGFEIRDQLAWVFGSGFPKSHNLDGDWAGWGTALKPALKPAWEPIVLARKPLDGTVAVTVAKHGTGAVNIDGCRIEGNGAKMWQTPPGEIWITDRSTKAELVDNPRGRWPANLCHDGSAEVLARFPDSSGQCGDLAGQSKDRVSRGILGDMPAAREFAARGDAGSAARFFYCAKASKRDREAGTEFSALAEKSFARSGGAQNAEAAGKQYMAAQTIGLNRVMTRRNIHPTVKPTDLMRWLCRLVTPPGGLILDPFTGSGSTGRGAVLEGFRFVGIEREAEYIPIATARIDDVCVL